MLAKNTLILVVYLAKLCRIFVAVVAFGCVNCVISAGDCNKFINRAIRIKSK